jgi:hypothetical protein
MTDGGGGLTDKRRGWPVFGEIGRKMGIRYRWKFGYVTIASRVARKAWCPMVSLQLPGDAIRFCRWYDRVPRLKTALELVRLAPLAVQRQIFEALARLMHHLFYFRQPSLGPGCIAEASTDTPRLVGNRWYDISQRATHCMAMLSQCSQGVQNRMATLMLWMIHRWQLQVNAA